MTIPRYLVVTLFFAAACVAHARTGHAGSFFQLATSSHPEHGHDSGIITEGHPHEAEEDPHHVAHAKHVDEHVSEHVEHGATPQHSGVNGPCPGNQSANSVAVGLMASVVLMPIIMYMLKTKAAGGSVSNLTFQMIDMSTSIFLAVLWFSASADVLEFPTVKKAFPHAEEAFAITQVLLLYGLTMLVAYQFRNNKYYLLTFCGCAGHYIAFAGIRATGESQHVVGKMVDHDQSVYASFGFCLVVLAIFTVMSLICFFSWRRYLKNEELHLAIEELELDIIGLVLSFAIMQALRHALTGHYPAQAHMFLQGDDHGHGVQHSAAQRMFMLGWSIGLTLIACLSLSHLEAWKERSSYWVHKFVHTVQVVLIMCVAWGYLLWGEWQFYETYFHGDKMFGKMVFAVIATCVCLMIITALAFATNERFSNAKGYADLCVMAVSLVAAWSWEHCFHTAVNVISEQYQVGYGGLVPKLVIALGIPLVILPGYITFLKPIAAEIDEELHAKERETLNAQLNAVLYSGPATEAEGAADSTAAGSA